jgi:RNA polymerase sigma-70 factor, ECF subfamily
MITDDKKTQTFGNSRARLFGIAYRMLGTHSDAEDVLQEAYIKWHQANETEIETPEAWLVTIVTRLSIDRLRIATRERETYIGPWLPEPLIVSDAPTPAEELEFSSNLSLAFLTLLERLAPLERAVFLLHDVFDCDYKEIARITGKAEATARQMIHRARERVRTDKPRFKPDESEHAKLIRKFAAASATGDEKTLSMLFAEEISLVSDGGGKVNAARKIIGDKNRVLRLFVISGAKHGALYENRLARINGELGLLTYQDEILRAATTFEFDGGKISKIYRVMNPDKLKILDNPPE